MERSKVRTLEIDLLAVAGVSGILGAENFSHTY